MQFDSTSSSNNLLSEINFHSEDISFELPDQDSVTGWIVDAFKTEHKNAGTINYVFCSDSYLHQLNVQYLNHDTLTDVITFPFSEPESKSIDGDIFISIDRVKENAQLFNVSFESELYRVMIHGSLHLMGYLDKTPEDIQLMRQKENTYLAQYMNS